ncbi:YdcF family protein [Pontibacter sp. 172403-2]|uniref:YdcF family protein n=1 Tax=Pontibacter rufus TaxID=2791028 RepID=UPI0018AFB9F9|nr:YdcF family protein [Pontibacter sp. 172403-2]MBF9254195.1 YdcF family protein [Pontibacter sp. 172403-2]
MYFILSKTLDFLLMPFLWVLLLLLLALFLKSAAKKRFCLVSAVTILLVLSNPWLANIAWRAWEVDAVPVSQVKSHDVAIILTGVTSYRNDIPDRIHTAKGADRFLQALQLYRLGKIDKFLISGGSGLIIKDKVPEAVQIKKILLIAGVPEGDIFIESNSRNTRENAVNTGKVLAKHPEWERPLLVTSAFHMRRAAGCFRKAGIKTDTYSTDFYAGEKSYALDDTIIPSIEAFDRWHLLLHEIAGYAVYKLLGYC